jgi:hypothetical protein
VLFGNDTTFLILGTLAILVGGAMITVGPPDNFLEFNFYVSGIILVVLGIVADTIIIIRTNLRIRELEDRVSKLERNNSQ